MKETMREMQDRMGRVVWVVAALQFVYILDFMLVLPLGADLALALGFAARQLGWLTAAYCGASVLAGLAALRWLDRFNRKRAMLCAFALLALATFVASLATDLATLMAARALTGLFGGPAIALAMAMVVDATAPQQRGRAFAKVMLGFSVAAVLGVPAALELTRLGDWRTPFQVLAALAALVWLVAARLLPSMPVAPSAARVSLRVLLGRAAVRQACLVQCLNQLSAFLVLPHVAAYFLLNLGFPRAQLSWLYAAGGVTALVAANLLGRLADRVGPVAAVTLATLAIGIGLLPFFAPAAVTHGALALLFVLFMAGNAGRNVSVAAALSQVPGPHERGAFMALQNLVQDGSIGLAALLGWALLGADEAGRINGMPLVAACALALAVLVPFALGADKKSRPKAAVKGEANVTTS